MLYRILLFIAANFAALAIGAYFTNSGVSSGWYESLDKAPWTPPGWVFGAAWGFLMVCFTIYMAYATKKINSKALISAFCVQWVLNVLWNPVFFYFHNVAAGLVIISALTILVVYMCVHYYTRLKDISFWILPYITWMLVASSLNAYIFVSN